MTKARDTIAMINDDNLDSGFPGHFLVGLVLRNYEILKGAVNWW